jgi:hypothetical protein
MTATKAAPDTRSSFRAVAATQQHPIQRRLLHRWQPCQHRGGDPGQQISQRRPCQRHLGLRTLRGQHLVSLGAGPLDRVEPQRGLADPWIALD